MQLEKVHGTISGSANNAELVQAHPAAACSDSCQGLCHPLTSLLWPLLHSKGGLFIILNLCFKN